jgi:hypothetical protein
MVMIATSPATVSACQKAFESAEKDQFPAVELMTWLDVS